MAYPEYDPNEESLGQVYADMLRGMSKKQAYQEMGQGIKNVAKVTPSVVESLGRGAGVQLVPTGGDTSEMLRQVAPQTMQDIFGNRTAPTSEEMLAKLARMTPDYQGSQQHEMMGGVLSPTITKFPPKIIARAISPLSKPQVFTESTVTAEGLPRTLANISGNAEAEKLALERYKTAASPSLQNVTPKQGYWMGESNPVFVAEGNRSLTVGGNKKLLKDMAQTAENLEQAGATTTRATALPYGDLSKGNAAFLTRNGKPLTNADVVKLNKVLSESTDAVLQHRKNGEGLLFKGDWIEGVTLQDMVNIAKKEIPDLKIKPALSSPKIDRTYYERPEYQSLGALPREESVKGKLTQAFDELLKKQGYRE